MGKKLLALTRLKPQISDPTCLHQMSIVLIVVFHIRSQKGLAVKHHSFTTCFPILYLECTHTYIYILLYQYFFFFFFPNFVVCKFCRFFPLFYHFLSPRIHSIFFLKSQFLQKKLCSHSVKIHQEKSLLCTEFLLFFHSGFICYDRPCNFSFSPQAAPIIATGQGEPAPTLVHSPS